MLLENSVIALLSTDESQVKALNEKLGNVKHIVCFKSPFELYEFSLQYEIDIVITPKGMDSASGIALMNTLRKENSELIFIFFLNELKKEDCRYAFKSKVSEVFDWTISSEALRLKLNYLLERKSLKRKRHKRHQQLKSFIPLYKRFFDIAFASVLLLCISPLLLLIALLIQLESKGPVIYYSSRVGTGYRIFKFYKFRSMRLNADQQLKNMAHLNQYNDGQKSSPAVVISRCEYCAKKDIACTSKLYTDGKEYCENLYQLQEAESTDSTFIKIKDDPRVTRIGRFIRNTSIDELPQLFNVLIGDMSIVGNRPLPLYEAEKLTTDQFSERFHAPAGITGLWQISKRGQGDMTEEERIALDNQYARNYSLWLDLQILFRTFSALVQKENV